jgi:hypothetical protein
MFGVSKSSKKRDENEEDNVKEEVNKNGEVETKNGEVKKVGKEVEVLL